jgi:predicted nucleic acid-binding protein
MTNLIVDASVAARWFVPAFSWASAVSLLKAGHELIAPELILAETANAFWKAVRAGYMTPDEMQAAVAEMPACFIRLTSLRALSEDAAEIAVSLNHPAYDCFYLALARREHAPLVTADKRLASVAQTLPGVEVQLLAGV